MGSAVLAAGVLLPLALDTFALASALAVAGLEANQRLRVALVFTAFEAGMPVVGLVGGRLVGGLIGGWTGYAGIVFLVAAGLLLLWQRDGEASEERRLQLLAHARGLAVLDLGLSISVDELTIGVSAGFLGLPIVLTIVWIAVQAFAATQLGFALGSRIGETLRERSEQAAGAALIAVALVLLVLRLLSL